MASKTFNVKYRPIKLGLLVRDGNVEDLIEAVGINSLLWGGIYNPIIPVTENEFFTEYLIDSFNVDILYSISKDAALEQVKVKYDFLNDPFFYPFLFYNVGSYNEISFVDSSDIILAVWEKNFKNRPIDFKSNCFLLDWDNDDKCATLLTVIFGYYPDKYPLKYNINDLFLKLLYGNKIHIEKGTIVDPSLLSRIYPIRLTSEFVDSTIHGLILNDGFYFGMKDNFYDLINFWNLRASGVNIMFIALDSTEKFSELLKDHYAKLLELLIYLEPKIIVGYVRKENLEVAKLFIDTLHLDNKITFTICDKINIGNFNVLEIHTENNNVIVNTEYSDERFAFTTLLPEYPLFNNVKLKKYIVSLSSYTDFEHPLHIFIPPFIKQFNKFYSKKITYSPATMVRSERFGIGIIISGRKNTLNFSSISYDELFNEIFKNIEVKANHSHAGQITLRIMEQMSGLENCRVFKLSGVRKVLGDKRLQSIVSHEELSHGLSKSVIEQIIDDEGYLGRVNQFGIDQDVTFNKESIFNYLLQKEVLRVGLELKCKYCGLSNWLTLKNIDDNWYCNYCGFKNQTSLNLKGKEGWWKYKLNGIFLKESPNKQSGSIPSILTLLRLSQNNLISQFIYCTSLNIYHDLTSNKYDYEIDFIAINSSDDTLEIAIGECKDDGGEIDQKDVNHLVKLQKLFIKHEFKCFIIFSKTSERISKNEVELFTNMVFNNIPCIIFTNKELEPYDLYEKYDKKEIPCEYPRSFYDLAQNSYHIYLKQNHDARKTQLSILLQILKAKLSSDKS